MGWVCLCVVGTGDAVIDVGWFVLWVRAVLSLTWAVCVVGTGGAVIDVGGLCGVGTGGAVIDVGGLCCGYGRCCY